jgi:hypothetical protein
MGQQVVAAVPTYVAVVLVALLLTRATSRLATRLGGRPMERADPLGS